MKNAFDYKGPSVIDLTPSGPPPIKSWKGVVLHTGAMVFVFYLMLDMYSAFVGYNVPELFLSAMIDMGKEALRWFSELLLVQL